LGAVSMRAMTACASSSMECCDMVADSQRK
jgi:hypothetical protein